MTERQRRSRLEDILVEEGALRPEDLEAAQAKRDGARGHLGWHLVEQGFLTEEALAAALARLHALPLLDPAEFALDKDLLDLFPLDRMLRDAFLPLRRPEGMTLIAVADPGDLFLLDTLRELLGPVEIGVAPRGRIQEQLRRVDAAQRALREITEDFKLDLLGTEDEEDFLSLEKLKADISPIIRLVDTIILNALERRASDIHIEADEKSVWVKYRVDGMLYPSMEPIDKRYHNTIVSRIKIMAELDIAERRIPQDGRFKLRLKGRPIDFRVSVLPSHLGEAVVIRILDKEAITKELAELRLNLLGFPEADLQRFRRLLARPHGMILVTGPTGSGKTTTLYAAISEINTGTDKIVTIEDPIEYQLKHVVQIPVNEKKGLTFARGLRSILRHDPDKIMVGEIRDPETAQIAVQAALTGHLVFTTVHANNILDVIGRFIHMGLEPYNFLSALNCILTQRLVRVVCLDCAAPATYTATELAAAGLDPICHARSPFRAGRGCPTCHFTGYRGRTVIAELVEITDRIRELILARRPGAEIRAAVREADTLALREAALLKVLAGTTTLAEIDRVTYTDFDETGPHRPRPIRGASGPGGRQSPPDREG